MLHPIITLFLLIRKSNLLKNLTISYNNFLLDLYVENSIVGLNDLFMINKHAKYCVNWILFTIQLMLANLLRIHSQPKIFGIKALLLLLDLIYYPIHKLIFVYDFNHKKLKFNLIYIYILDEIVIDL